MMRLLILTMGGICMSSKLYFYYGAMGSSKTANALMIAFNYEQRNQSVLFLKPKIDSRFGGTIVKSRIGIQRESVVVDSEDNLFYLMKDFDPDVVIVDEVQFMSPNQIIQLSKIVDDYDIPVLTFGLRTDFKGNLFPGSEMLFRLADTFHEIKTMCWCGKKATMNARIVNKKVVKSGSQIQIGGDESYVSLCREHWENNDLGSFIKN